MKCKCKYKYLHVIMSMLVFLMAGTIPLVRASGVLTGTVSGSVVDKATNQPLPGAEVLLTNMRTGAVRRTLSGASGEYVFSQVYPPGIYSLTVQLQGFRTVESTNLQVAINDTATPIPPIALEKTTGPSATQTIETKAGIVNTSDSMRKMVIDPQATRTLPMSGVRSFDRLALLAPGVYEVPAATGTGPGVGPGVGTAGQFSVNGQRGRNNNFLVDGSDNNDQDVGVRRQGYVSLVPQSVESIENYQIISSSYSAEFGRNSGSIANAVSKTGENNVHGTVYGYYTNDKLQGRNFFDQKDGPARGESPYQRSQYGLAMGGPFAKDKSFWFGSFELQRIKDRPEKHFSVATEKQRSYFGLSPLGDCSKGVDPLTAAFQQKKIMLFGCAGQAIWGLVPMPNNVVGPYKANTYTTQLNGDGKGSILSFKLDQKLSDANTLTARYNFTDDTSTIPVTGGGINSSIRPEIRTQNLSLFLNSVIGANATNQVRFSYGRTHLNFLEAAGSPLLFGSGDMDYAKSVASQDPIYGPILVKIFSTPIKTDFGRGTYGPFGGTGTLGQMQIRPYSPIGVDVYNFPQSRTNNTFQYADTYSHRVKKHIFKGGLDIHHSQQNSRLDRNTRALVDFNGGYSKDPRLPLSFFRGQDLASIGYATGIMQTLIPDFNGDGQPDFDTGIGLRFTEYSLFLQDDWKVSPRFTVNLGIRYEFNTTPRDFGNRIEATFKNLMEGVPTQATFTDPALKAYQAAFAKTVAALQSVLAGRHSIYDSDRNNIAPRVGIVVDPIGDGKTSIRAGFGMFYDQNISAVTSQSRNVFPRLIPLNVSGFAFPLDGVLLNNPATLFFSELSGKIVVNRYPIIAPGTVNAIGVPGSRFSAVIGAASLQGGSGVAFTLPEKNLDTPYAEHFHVTFEREIMPETIISLAYVGSRGVCLTRFRSPNGGIAGTPGIDEIDSNFQGFKAWKTNTTFANRIDPNLGAFTIFENSAHSKYNSFQASIQRRLSKGLQFTSTYAWAYAKDDVSDVFDGRGFYAMPQNDKDLKKEFAYANFDVRHRWVSSWVWDIPMGGNNWLLNGWRLAGMFTAQTAQPFTVNSSFDVNQDGNLTDRLNAVDGITSTDRGPAQYVLAEGKVVDGNGSSMLAGTGKDGSIGRNSFRARGIASLDLSLLKTFRIDEQRNFEFRTEFFNFFNRTHFGVPVRILEAPSFGQAVDTALNPRNVQFALKFNF